MYTFICRFKFVQQFHIQYHIWLSQQNCPSQSIIVRSLSRTFLAHQNMKYLKIKTQCRSVHIALSFHYWPWRILSRILSLSYSPASFTNPSWKEKRSWIGQVQIVLHKFTNPWSKINEAERSQNGYILFPSPGGKYQKQ